MKASLSYYTDDLSPLVVLNIEGAVLIRENTVLVRQKRISLRCKLCIPWDQA